MDRITSAQVFNRICQLGSLSATARALGMSRPMVSRYLAEMEQWAGTRLLHRSSRRLSLTPAGEHLLQYTKSLEELANSIAEQQVQQSIAGTVRISCAHLTARKLLAPILPEFLKRHPAVRVEMAISNQNVNLVEERIDLAIRITNELDPNVIARYLGECHSQLCASPNYLQQHGTPRTPAQLAGHNCLHYSLFTDSCWQLRDKDGEPLDISVRGNLSINESSLLLMAALDGAGIALLPTLDVADYIAKGQLVRLLPDYPPEPLKIYGIYRSRQLLPAPVRLLLDEISQYLQRQNEAAV